MSSERFGVAVRVPWFGALGGGWTRLVTRLVTSGGWWVAYSGDFALTKSHMQNPSYGEIWSIQYLCTLPLKLNEHGWTLLALGSGGPEATRCYLYVNLLRVRCLCLPLSHAYSA